jgi:CP family cyanate transporter-like MFS transporter
MMLTSFTLGVFLPFICKDLQLSPLQAGLLQGVSWMTAALMALPSGVWFSRFRPVPLVFASLLLSTPFLFLQGLAWHFLVLLVARLGLSVFHEIATPARPLLLQQWVAPRHYALVHAVGLSQHSILMATAISTSAWLIVAVGSWRLAYCIQGGFLVAQILAWVFVAREGKAPVPAAHLQRALQAPQETPLRALWSYPQGWLLGITMCSLAATWTTVVTFLPTLLLERGITVALGGPVLACLYYGLIPSAPFAGLLARRVQQRKLLLWVPALCNTLLGIAIVLTPSPWLLMGLLTGMGVVWIVSPTLEVLPFEFTDIRPRQVAMLVSLVKTLSGLGFAVGPVVTGVVTQYTGSLQTGCLTLCGLTSVGIIAGLLYPSSRLKAWST